MENFEMLPVLEEMTLENLNRLMKNRALEVTISKYANCTRGWLVGEASLVSGAIQNLRGICSLIKL